MMKRWTAIFVIFLLLSLLVACAQPAPAADERELSVFELTISDEMKQKIQNAYYDWYEETHGFAARRAEWNWEDTTDGRFSFEGYRYYGTFDACTVWFVGGTADMVWDVTVAGSEFSHSAAGNLFAYRNGKHYTLEQAYALGYISAEDVAIVAQRHEAFNQAIHEAIAQRVERESK